MADEFNYDNPRRSKKNRRKLKYKAMSIPSTDSNSNDADYKDYFNSAETGTVTTEVSENSDQNDIENDNFNEDNSLEESSEVNFVDNSGVVDNNNEIMGNSINDDLENGDAELTTETLTKIDAGLNRPPSYEEKAEDDKEFDETNSVEEEGEIVDNLRVLPKDAMTYELENFKQNAMIIFNQENINGYEARHGTNRDVESLTNTFSNLGFQVKEHKDLTKNEVFQTLKEFSQKDFTDYGCVCVAVLTHGSHYGMIRAKDMPYNESDILEFLKVHDKPTLITKPKILIIQACRGTKISESIKVSAQARVRRDVDHTFEPYYLPVESDMLIVHSSFVGNASHRHEVEGSWFIQTLCKNIKKYSHKHDLESIITFVKKEVAIEKYNIDYNRRNLRISINKQMPVSTSTLIRKLYLKKYDEASRIEKEIAPKTFTDVIEDEIGTGDVGCTCYLNHFSYLRKCLRYYVADNPNDITARSFLDVSDTYEDTPHFHKSKERTAEAICKHLQEKAKKYSFYKYMYFYKHTN